MSFSWDEESDSESYTSSSHSLFSSDPPTYSPIPSSEHVEDDRRQLEFYKGIAELWLSSKDHPPDLKIKVAETIYSAHRCILSIRTHFFSNALAALPTTTNTVEIEGHAALTVWWFLQWSYMGRYSTFGEQLETFAAPSQPVANGLEHHLAIYRLANYLECQGLEERAAYEYMKFWSGSNWEPESFLKSAREVFTSDPNRQDCLRDAVVAVARRYHTSLKKEKEFVTLVNEVKGFAGALVWKQLEV